MTAPRPTPGGLATQFSSVGHYDLADDQAMIVTVPAAGHRVAPYQGIQLGSMWYVSLDYINHQTSLTADQARTSTRDGMIRFVISERDPGRGELAGAHRAPPRLRADPLAAADPGAHAGRRAVGRGGAGGRPAGPRCPTTSRPGCPAAEYAARIAARQAAVAEQDAGLMLLAGKVVVVCRGGTRAGPGHRGAQRPGGRGRGAGRPHRQPGWTRWPRRWPRWAAAPWPCPADITDDAAAAALAEAALAEFGRVDTLVHNAFAIPPMTGLAEVDLDAIRAAVDTNVIAALRLTRLFTPALAASAGSVVMINSAVLRHSRLPFGGYKMAKCGAAGAGPEPGHRARPAGHPGQLGGARLDLGRRAQVVLRLPGRAARGDGRRRSTRRPRPPPTCAGCPSRTRSPTRWCSWPPAWPGPSPASASTSTAASSTIDRGRARGPCAERDGRRAPSPTCTTSAIRITGLADFGTDDYRDGLAVLLESYTGDAGLTPLGRQVSPRPAARRADRPAAQRGRLGRRTPSTRRSVSSGPCS